MVSAEEYNNGVGPACVKVKRHNAELFRRGCKRFIDDGYRVTPCDGGESVCFPVHPQHVVDAVECGAGLGVTVSECDTVFQPRQRGSGGLKELVPGIPFHSYVAIGDIALIHPPYGVEWARVLEAGRVLVEKMGFRAAYAKRVTRGRERVADLVLLAGQPGTETLYREYGLVFHVDVARAYVNPRLGFERARVAELVGEGETVLDMFSGVGGHVIHIASKHDSLVVSLDANPWAVYYQGLSLRRNPLRGEVDLYLMDSGIADRVFRHRFFDRVIMDHPTGSEGFVPVACRLVREGGVIHFYRVGGEVEDDVREVFERVGCVVSVERSRRVLPYSPRRYIWVYDVRVDRPL